MRTPLALSVLTLAALGCRDAPDDGAQSASASAKDDLSWRDEAPAHPPSLTSALATAECATLRDVETADVIRASEGLVLYANEQTGLAAFDVTGDEPKLVSTSPFVGTPLAVFTRGSIVLVAFVEWDARAGAIAAPRTILRAIDLASTNAPVRRSEVALPGVARDVRRIADVIVVTRDGDPGDGGPAGSTIVTSLTVGGARGDRLVVGDEIVLPGRSASVSASPAGIVVARPAPAPQAAEQTSVTWVDVAADARGRLRPRGTIAVAGVITRLRTSAERILSADEDLGVRLYTCASAGCPAHASAIFAEIDFSDPDHPRETQSLTIPHGSDAVTTFQGNRLFAAQPLDDGNTQLMVFHTTPRAASEGALRLTGTVSGMVVRDSQLVTIGWTGTPGAASTKATVHVIDLASPKGTPRSPHLRGSVSFGRDWTWSPAYDDQRALTFDPGTALAALPTTTLSTAGQGHYTAGAHLLTFGPSGPRVVTVVDSERFHDRLVFAGGKLLGFGAEGIVTLHDGRDHAPARMRTWRELQLVQ